MAKRSPTGRGPTPDPAARLVERIRRALESSDRGPFRELLTPDARWAVPGDRVGGCHNRDQAVDRHRRRPGAGMRSRVIEVVAGVDQVLVGVTVTGPGGAGEGGDGGEAQRWQVLTLRDGLVADIRGHDDRTESAALAGVSS